MSVLSFISRASSDVVASGTFECTASASDAVPAISWHNECTHSDPRHACHLSKLPTHISHHYNCMLEMTCDCDALCPADRSTCVCSTQASTSLVPSFLVKPPTPAPSWEECQASDQTQIQTDTAHALALTQQLLNFCLNSHLYSTHRQQPLQLSSCN